MPVKAPETDYPEFRGKLWEESRMASAVDYCCYKNADVKLSETAVGIGPFVVGPCCRTEMGTSAIGQLAINATEWQPATWSLWKGLYAHVYDTVEELNTAVDKLAETLSTSNPEAMSMLKSDFLAGEQTIKDELLSEEQGMTESWYVWVYCQCN